jgi:hypothetical protein
MTAMSPRLGQPAEDEQAPPAEGAAGTGAPAEPTAPDAPVASRRFSDLYADSGTYADSGASSVPAAPDALATSDASSTADAPNTPDASSTTDAPSTIGAPAAPSPSVPHDAAGAPMAHGTTSAAAAPADEEAAPVCERTAPDGRRPVSARLEESAAGLDGPLLPDVAGLRASWQRIQAGFVDDPKEAVADAADLVEHMAQALVGALHHRQRLLRARWDRGGSPDGPGSSASGSPAGPEPAATGQPTADDVPDTEQLRLLMQRYRTFFNQVCRP